MSLFEHLERIASGTVNTVNAIPFVFTPMKVSPNGRPGPDPDRPVIEARGIFDYLDSNAGVELGNRTVRGSGNDLHTVRSAVEPVLSVDRRIFGDVSCEPRQDDVIEFPSRPDLPVFTVVSARRDGMSRLEVKLAQAV